MNLIINGDNVEVPSTITTVRELLQHFGLDYKVVIVELNNSILEKDSHQENQVADGDKLELVHFVGGG